MKYVYRFFLCATAFFGTVCLMGQSALATPAAKHKWLEINQGHIDIFHGTSLGADNLVLQMADDTGGPRVYRTPESAILTVQNNRWMKASELGPFAQYTGNKPAAVLPLAQENNSLWPGWDMLEVRPNFSQIDIVFTDVIGPKGGKVLLAGGASGGLGSVDFTDYLVSSDGSDANKYEVRAGKHIHVPFPTHTHVYWLFTKPGVYQFRAYLRDGNSQKIENHSCVKSRVATYTWKVADAGLVTGSKEIENYGQPVVPNDCKMSTAKSAYQVIGDTVSPTPGELFTNDESSEDHGTEGTSSDDNKSLLPVDDCKTQGNCGGGAVVNPKPRAPKTVHSPQPPRSHSGSNVVNTSPNYGSAGAHFVANNTHVHTNWVFTAPGKYRVVLRQTAKLKTGKVVSVDAPLTFVVGGLGNANEGHFDLGARFNGSGMEAIVKDDRSSPARYVAPSSLTFGLGQAAKETAGKGIEFIAKPGTTIYRIPEVQKSGVPWLGVNTMDPSLLNKVSRGVVFSIAAFDGPGDMALFSGGGFGGNYKIWLNTANANMRGGAASRGAHSQGNNVAQRLGNSGSNISSGTANGGLIPATASDADSSLINQTDDANELLGASNRLSSGAIGGIFSDNGANLVASAVVLLAGVVVLAAAVIVWAITRKSANLQE